MSEPERELRERAAQAVGVNIDRIQSINVSFNDDGEVQNFNVNLRQPPIALVGTPSPPAPPDDDAPAA